MTDLKDIIDRAQGAYDAGMYEEALELYQEALELDKEDIDSWINLGLCYRHLEDFEKALEAYMQATKIDPNSKLAWNNMGWAYHCKNEEDWAIDAYKKALEIDPTYDRALVNLADAYNNRGQYEKTVVIFEQALDIDPTDYNNWIDLGFAYRHLAEYDKAVEAYNQALKCNPDDKLAWNNIGWAYYSMEELHMAIDSYKHSLKLDWRYDLPYKNLITAEEFMSDNNVKDYLLWKSLANAFLVGHDYEKALKGVNRCLMLKPNFKSALKLQEKITEERKKFEDDRERNRLIEDALNTFLTASKKCKIDDIIDYVKYKASDLKFKDVEIKVQIIDRIKDGRLRAKLDGEKIEFID